MIIFTKIRISIDYKVFILLNVHPAERTEIRSTHYEHHGFRKMLCLNKFLITLPPAPPGQLPLLSATSSPLSSPP